MYKSIRKAFTLLEVMISVVIISVVILALYEIRGNSNLIFFKIDNSSKVSQYLSLLIDQENYGFERKTTSIKNLTTEFDIKYIELESIDMKDYDEGSEMIFEIGTTNIKINDNSASFLRIKLQ